MEGEGRAAAVDEEADDEPGDDAADDGQRGGLGGLRDRDLQGEAIARSADRCCCCKDGRQKLTYTGDKDDGLETLTENRDEGQHEQDPLGRAALALVLLGELDILLVDELDVVRLALAEAAEDRLFGRVGVLGRLRVEGGLELDAPLGTRAVETADMRGTR